MPQAVDSNSSEAERKKAARAGASSADEPVAELFKGQYSNIADVDKLARDAIKGGRPFSLEPELTEAMGTHETTARITGDLLSNVDPGKAQTVNITNNIYGDFVNRDINNYQGTSKESSKSKRKATLTSNPKKWFDALPSDTHRIFAITLAFFNGLKERDLLRVFSLFEQAQLRGPNKAERDGSENVSIFSKGTLDLIKEVEAEHFTRNENSDLGVTQVRAIRYIDPAAPHIIVELIRSDALLTNMFLESMRKLGSDDNLEVRSFAAGAIGELAKGDIQTIRADVLSAWANSDSPRERAVVGYALLSLALDSKYKTLVENQLKSWVRGGNSNQKWTSVAACGNIGSYVPELAMSLIEEALKDPVEGIGNVARHSVRSMFQVSNQSRSVILRQLAGWVTSKNFSLRLAAVIMLLDIAMINVVVEQKDSAAGSDQKESPNEENQTFWQWLASVTKANPSAQELKDAVSILNFGLNRWKITQDLSVAVIRAWFLHVETHIPDQTSLGLLIRTLYFSPEAQERDKKRICYHLERWAHGKPVSKFAGTLSRQLSCKSV